MSTIAFDTETKGLDWFNPDQQAFLVSWANGIGSFHTAVDDEEGMKSFKAALHTADTVVAHNLAFDVHQLRATCGIDLLTSGKQLVDTAHLAQVTLPERRNGEGEAQGYKLKNLCKTYLGDDSKDAEDAILEMGKKIGLRTMKQTGAYYEVWRAYPAEMEHYAREDARMTLALYHALKTKVTDKTEVVWNLELATAPVLIEAEQHGVAIDQSKVTPLVVEYTRRQTEAHAELVETLGEEALEGDQAMLAALLAHGVPLHRRTPSGELATNKFALAEFEDAFPVLATLSEHRQASKFLSTYVGPMVDRDTVHPSFWQMGAWTGRMSCSRPNMQNIPSRAGNEVREMFVPRPGHCFVVADYDAIEVRLLAHYLNSTEYKELIREGLDPHAWMAAQIHGGEMDEFLKGTPGEKQRTEAKNVLFAIVYGAGGPRVADMLGIDIKAARDLIRTIKTTLPRYLELTRRIKQKVELSGYVTTIAGRKQSVKRDKSYVGLNALIQGSAADIFKFGACNVADAVKPFGARPVLFVHDEIVVETPLEQADDVLAATVAGLNAAWPLDPPLAVTAKIAYNNYAEAK